MPSASARRRAALVAVAVFACVAALGLATRREPPLAMSPARAQALTATQPKLRPIIRRATEVKVLRVDDRMVKVVWYRGARLLAWVGVWRDGRVTPAADDADNRIGFGAPLSRRLGLLAALTALFLLATLRAPLRSRRTLDVLALSAFAVVMVVLDRSFVKLSETLAAALLAWLVVSGVLTAWRGPCDGAAQGPSLLERAARGLGVPRLRTQLGALLLVVTLLVTLTSTGIVDVAPATMEGATRLLHGVLPYGHMPGDIVHGDTYGLPIYALYTPVAALWPVHDDWDEATGALVLAAIAVVVLAAGLARALGGSRRTAALALLAFPATLMSVSSGTNDVVVAAALAWALAWWSRPAASSAVIAVAGLAKVAPMALLPLWLARLRGAQLAHAVAACAAGGAVVLAGLVAFGGLHGPLDMVHAMAFQLDRRSELSPWTALDAGVLQPLTQAVVLAVALGGAVLVALDRAVAADPRRVAGLVTAVLAGLQLSANHWMPLYLLWLLPPAMVALIGPLDVRPAAATAGAPHDDTAPVPAAAAGAPLAVAA